MKFIAILELCLILLTASYNAIPTGRAVKKNNTDLEFNNKNIKDDNNTDIEGNSVDGSDVVVDTDTSLGSNTDGDQNEENDNTLAAWSESSLMNPEEMGGYFEGDIIINPLRLRNGLEEDRTWPNGIIPYSIEANFTAERRATIMVALDHYHRFTCVRFVPYENQTDYLIITNNNTGCNADLGRIGGPQTLNIGSECLLGNIIHELMHTVGFLHEICREDRDDYIIILEENIEDGKDEDFQIYLSNPFQVPYDYASILHYGEYAFSKNEKRTIKATRNDRGIKLGQRSRLSRGDITKINRMYDCEPTPKTC